MTLFGLLCAMPNYANNSVLSANKVTILCQTLFDTFCRPTTGELGIYGEVLKEFSQSHGESTHMGTNDINQMGKFYTTNMIYDSLGLGFGRTGFSFRCYH